MNSIHISKPNLINGILIRLIVCVFTLLSFSSLALAGSLQLAWDASSSSNVGGYKIYYGQTTNNYTSSVDAGNVTSYQMTGLQDGAKYFFAVKAYNLTKTIESSYSNEVSATVPALSTMTADFTASKTSGNPGMVVSFTPVTTGTISQWSWDFGDGGTSTAQNPTHTYNLAGAYTVGLTVSGTNGSANKIAPNFITVVKLTVPPPVASFSVSSISGTAPASISFTDSSTGDIGSRLWNFGDGTTSTSLNPSHTYTVAGAYSVSLTVTGTGGTSTKNSSITILAQATNSNGLVAAYNFDAITNSLITDNSGSGNNGIANGPTLTTAGRYGNALIFDGINDLVTVNDSASLDLSTGFTMEAWFKPLVIKRSSLLFKEQATTGSVYNLYGYEDADKAVSAFNDGVSEHFVSTYNPMPINKWTHLASTYDGVTLRMYRNGNNVFSRKVTGTVKQSNGVLQIGGNKVWGEYFNGHLDDVRIYNRALTQLEIQADLKTPVSNTAIATTTKVASSPTLIVGNSALESAVDSNSTGSAEAFLTTAQKTGTVTKIEVYLDATSTATELVAGIYSDNNGHPGTLLGQGKLSTLKSGATNTVTIPSTSLVGATRYWIALLGTKGQIKFRDRMGSGVSPLETSAAGNLINLPSQWATGTVYPKDGPMSVYGTGL